MTFRTLAEGGLGFFHAWSQDIFLDTQVSPEHEGICYAACGLWIEQRYLAIRSGNPPRKSFHDFMMMSAGKNAAVKLQEQHAEILDEIETEDPKIVLAAKYQPVLERLGTSGLTVLGATVTQTLSVATSFVTAQTGYYLFGLHGKGGGHAFAAHHQTVDLARITLFDPNYGEVTHNFQGFYKTHFSAFFYSVMNTEYHDLKNIIAVFRIGRA